MNASPLYARQFEVIKGKAINDAVGALMERHESRRGELWFPSQFLPAGEVIATGDEEFTRDLRKRASTLPDWARVSLALNIWTEEGLPHFHRLLAGVVGYDSNLGRWNNLWTAEEDRHGNILRDYARAARIFDFLSFEIQQFEYIRAGFNPSLAVSPFKVFVYTTLQEKATQVSHGRTGVVAGEYEPLLEEILRKVAEDEARHYAFYLNLFGAVIDEDPNGALVAANEILPHIEMPGVLMPNFGDYIEVEARAGIYTLRNYKTLVEGVLAHWKVATLQNLDSEGARAQEEICAIPGRIERAAQRIDSRLKKQKTFSFEVIHGREFAL